MKFKKNLIEVMRSHVAVNCDTEEKAEALLKELAQHYIKWSGGEDLFSFNNWEAYGSKTCYKLEDTHGRLSLSFGCRKYFEDRYYKIIKFEELLEDENENDIISHPAHYCHSKYEPKDVIRDWDLNFNLGSAVKYIARAGHKDDIVQDLKKARQFISFEIEALEEERSE